MIKKIKIVILGVIGLSLFCSLGLIIGIYVEDKTVHYGHTSTIPQKRQNQARCQKLNIHTSHPLNIHASGLINFNDFKSQIPSSNYPRLYVVNLLDDDIYYYKNRCLRWYGLGYKKTDLGMPLFRHKKSKYYYKAILRLLYHPPQREEIIQNPSLVETEREIVEGMGATYAMPLEGKSNWLETQEYIPELIRFFESLPNDALLYVHCAHGKGRTTTFLVLYDIFKYKGQLTLQQIADRHYCLGREDILDTTVWENGSWTQEALLARKDLLERFYLYMTSGEKGYPRLSWEEWNSQSHSTNGAMNNPLPKVTSIHRR